MCRWLGIKLSDTFSELYRNNGKRWLIEKTLKNLYKSYLVTSETEKEFHICIVFLHRRAL